MPSPTSSSAFSLAARTPWRRAPGPALLLLTALLAGCASNTPSGYGVAPSQSTAVQAQQQLQSAEQSTQANAPQTYLDLIAQMQQAGLWYASLAHTEAFVQQYGAHQEIDLLRADALRNTGQTEAARQAYAALLASPEQQLAARAHRGLGLLHAAQQQYTQAIAALEQARRINPIDANVLGDLTYAYLLDGQVAAAQLPALQAAQLAPSNARVQLNLALYWLVSGQQTEAAQLLRRLSQPQPKNGPALIDASALDMLESQLEQVQSAIHHRASASPGASGTTPTASSMAAPTPSEISTQAAAPAQPDQPL